MFTDSDRSLRGYLRKQIAPDSPAAKCLAKFIARRLPSWADVKVGQLYFSFYGKPFPVLPLVEVWRAAAPPPNAAAAARALQKPRAAPPRRYLRKLSQLLVLKHVLPFLARRADSKAIDDGWSHGRATGKLVVSQPWGDDRFSAWRKECEEGGRLVCFNTVAPDAECPFCKQPLKALTKPWMIVMSHLIKGEVCAGLIADKHCNYYETALHPGTGKVRIIFDEKRIFDHNLLVPTDGCSCKSGPLIELLLVEEATDKYDFVDVVAVVQHPSFCMDAPEQLGISAFRM